MSAPRPLGMTSQGTGFELTSGALGSGALGSGALDVGADRVSSRRGLSAIGGLLVSGSLVAFAAAQTGTLLPESIRPVPAALAGAFGATGIDLHVGGLIAVLALMFASYVAVVRLSDQLSGRVILMTIGALYALVLLAPPLISTDIFSYLAYGRIGATYGANPYVLGPSAILLDHVYPFIDAQWVNTPTAYGPLFTALSYPLAHLDIAANVIAYKAIAAISSLVIVAGVWRAARLRGLDPVRAVALVGLNPVLVVYGVGGGHNDLLMLALLVAGV